MLLLIGRFLLAGGHPFPFQGQRVGRLLFLESQRVGLLLSVKLSRVAGIAGGLKTADRLLRAGDHRYGLEGQICDTTHQSFTFNSVVTDNSVNGRGADCSIRHSGRVWSRAQPSERSRRMPLTRAGAASPSA